jgi:hypothetical protein
MFTTAFFIGIFSLQKQQRWIRDPAVYRCDWSAEQP